MKKLFGLFLLALAFLAPDLAQAAARFAVCTTTCTWDNTSTAMWSATSGGATGQSAPVAGDDVTLDAATCVGGTTCTITTFAGTISVNTLIMSACTASTSGCILDASANNTNISIATSFTNTGSGTRTLNMGNGTWTMSGNTGAFSLNGATNLTFNANSSTLAFTGNGARRLLPGTSRTFNIVSATGGSSASFAITTATTIGTFTPAPQQRIILTAATSYTITTLSNISGAGSTPILFASDNPTNGVATISSANNFTCDFCGFQGVTFSGGGTFSASNSFSFSQNSNITITPPSGGGGGGRIIGG